MVGVVPDIGPRAAAGAGKLQIADVPLAARVFRSMAAGALFWPAVFEGPLPEDERERIIDELVATFLARYRA